MIAACDILMIAEFTPKPSLRPSCHIKKTELSVSSYSSSWSNIDAVHSEEQEKDPPANENLSL